MLFTDKIDGTTECLFVTSKNKEGKSVTLSISSRLRLLHFSHPVGVESGKNGKNFVIINFLAVVHV